MQIKSGSDSGIKLFGKNIPLPAGGEYLTVSGEEFPSLNKQVLEAEENPEKECSSGEVTGTLQQDETTAPSSVAEDSGDPQNLSDGVNPKTPSIDEESAMSRSSKSDKEQNNATNSQEKPLKKPDKILPCPRCNSMDTKFCYYNNYNVNQPRYFCKACQRYWTAGGTMRNVPVGAGRRKNKNSASDYRHISISEALQVVRIDESNGTHHPALKTNGRILSFGLDAPICDSLASSILNSPEKKLLNGTRNGFHRFELKQNPGPCVLGEDVDDCSSSVSVSSSIDEGGTTCRREPFVQTVNGLNPPIPCLSGVPWQPYPWNSTIAPPPAFCSTGFPMPFHPAAYWSGIPGAWNIPFPSPQSLSSSNLVGNRSSPNSPKLGKHSRERDALKPDELEIEEQQKHKSGCVLVPKILRIDDPNEAAKSSIWATLGIKKEPFSREGLFKGFQPKADGKNCLAETSCVLQANPAALSRSIDFHESS